MRESIYTAILFSPPYLYVLYYNRFPITFYSRKLLLLLLFTHATCLHCSTNDDLFAGNTSFCIVVIDLFEHVTAFKH